MGVQKVTMYSPKMEKAIAAHTRTRGRVMPPESAAGPSPAPEGASKSPAKEDRAVTANHAARRRAKRR